MNERKEPVRSYYANLKLWQNWKSAKWFPYTMPWHLINGFAAALDKVIAEGNVYKRHRNVACATRAAIIAAGLKLYSESGFSDSVTAFLLPEPLKSSPFLKLLSDEHGLLLGGAIGLAQGDEVIRIGHMGENCQPQLVEETLTIIEKALTEQGFYPQPSMAEVFKNSL